MSSSSSASFKSTESVPPSPMAIMSPDNSVPALPSGQHAPVPQLSSDLQLAIVPYQAAAEEFTVPPVPASETVTRTTDEGVVILDDSVPAKSRAAATTSKRKKVSIKDRTRAARKRKSIDLDSNSGSDSASSEDRFDSHRFVSAAAQKRFSLFAGRGIRGERRVDLKDPKQSVYSGMLASKLYSSSVSFVQGYCRDLVSEFYANASVTKPSEHGGLEVLIRGQVFVFSPSTINGFLNIAPLSSAEKRANEAVDKMDLAEIAIFLTGKPSTPIQSVNLPMKFAALAIIGSYNWIPASNKYIIADNRARLLYKIAKGIKVDLGSIIYEQVSMICACAETNNRLLVFPHLLAGMVQAQLGNVVDDSVDLIQPLSYKIDHRSGTDSAKAVAATGKETVSQRKSKRIKKETSSIPAKPPARSSSATTTPQHPETDTPYSIVNLGSIRIPLESVSVAEYQSLLDDLARTARTFSTVISMARQAIPGQSSPDSVSP